MRVGAGLREHPQRLQALGRQVGGAALVAIVYYLGARIGFALTIPPLPTSIFWLPNSTMFAVFLLAPTRRWWMFLLAAVPAHFAIQYHAGAPWLAIPLLFLTNVGDGAAGAALVKRFTGGHPPSFDDFREVLFFLLAAIVSPLVFSVLDAGVMLMTGWGAEFLPVWHTRFSSNVLTNITWTPALIVAVTRGTGWVKAASRARQLEALLLLSALLAVATQILAAAPARTEFSMALLYLPLPLFLWAAARFGSGGVSGAIMAFAFLVVGSAIQGHGPFAAYPPASNVRATQIFLTLLAAPLLFIAALVQERRRSMEVSSFLERSSTWANSLGLKRLVPMVFDQLDRLVPNTSATVLVEDAGTVVVLGHRGPLTRTQRADMHLPAHALANWTQGRGTTPLVVEDLWANSPDTLAFRLAAPEPLRVPFARQRSLLVVPLTVPSRVMGVLWIHHLEPRRFNLRDAYLAETLSRPLALAIDNARLYEGAREGAAREERQRIARDLHDSVSQTLHAAAMVAKMLVDSWDADPARGRQDLTKLQHLTDSAQAEMRALLLQLRPAPLWNANRAPDAPPPRLTELLHQLVDDMRPRIKAAIHARIEERIDELLDVSLEVHVTIYRIAQEAFSNIARHAPSATVVGFTCTCWRAGLALTVRDNGPGFNPGDTPSSRLGLQVMRERAASIGAALEIKSTAGTGTLIDLAWPGRETPHPVPPPAPPSPPGTDETSSPTDSRDRRRDR